MRDREFIVSFSSKVFDGKDASGVVNNVFEELGYKPIAADLSQRVAYAKGNKLATYMGLVNWNLIYREVEVEMLYDKAKVLLHYHFSWLTNIAVLVHASRPELRVLQREFGVKTLEVERYR